MNTEKNLLLAVALSVLVYGLWFVFIQKKYAPIPKVSTAQRQEQTSSPTPSASPLPQTPSLSVKNYPPINLDFGKAKLTVNPAGAGVISWKYQEPLGLVELVENPNPGFLAAFPNLKFAQDAKAPNPTFEARREDGLIIKKELIPAVSDKKVPEVQITLTNSSNQMIQTGAWSLSVGPGLGTVATEQKENHKVWRAFGLRYGGHGLNGKLDAFKPGNHQGPFQWVGIDNRYFLTALLPKNGEFSISSLMPPEILLTAPNLILNPKASHVWTIPFYIGPKGYTRLSRYHLGLERSISFGFFAQIGHLILEILEKIYLVTGNWGWSIILLTIGLQILVFPLTLKSLKAQVAIRKLQPEITKIQKKYASEPAKMNAEMMDLYKKNGANPLGGCLPMLIQAPVFIALYTTLRNAWELHASGWIFWIKDLSAKDPYYILPLVMGALMFAQNKLNPPPGDPAQAQIMTWMPVIFTIMFLNFPAGLVLYWLTNSLVNAVIQLGLKKYYKY